MMHVDASKLAKATKLFVLASHDTTPENEALGALRAMKRILDGAGVSISDLITQSDEIAAQKAENERIKADRDRYKARNERLKEELAAAEKRADRLERKLLDSQQAQVDDVLVDWQLVQAAVEKATGGHVSGMGIVALRLGLPFRVFNAWRTIGGLPACLYRRICIMAHEEAVKPSRKPWSPTEDAWLGKMVAKGKSALEIAQAFLRKFARMVLETSVRRAAKRLDLQFQT